MGEISKKVDVGTLVNQAIDEIGGMVSSNRLDIPRGYSFVNAIQQARFALTSPIESGKNKGKSIMDICTPRSILQSVIEMAEKGLSIDKKQCYFIPYGSICKLSISYQGNVALAKRSGSDISDVHAYAVYKDDGLSLGYDIETGTIRIEEFMPNIEDRKKESLIGAFAVVIDSKGHVKYTEYMDMEQIRASWNQGGANGDSPAHKNFPDQMAIKTVKNRAVKSFVNTADDSDYMSFDDISASLTDASVNSEIEERANAAEFQDDPFPAAIPESVDPDTGEISSGAPEGFFDSDFKPLDEKAPF